MLVLRRKKDERIIIGDDIEIIVIDIDGGRVRLGIEAPDHVRILRQELDDELKERGKDVQAG